MNKQEKQLKLTDPDNGYGVFQGEGGKVKDGQIYLTLVGGPTIEYADHVL